MSTPADAFTTGANAGDASISAATGDADANISAPTGDADANSGGGGGANIAQNA